MSAPRVLGLDVGGAHVKAALVAGDSIRAVTTPFALWREPGRLPEVIARATAELGARERDPDLVAVTMTAELADCFTTKADGVGFVLDALARALPGSALHAFTIAARFCTPAEARRAPLEVASANWLATASWLATEERDAILIDVGSTTTDVVPIVGGEVAAVGRTDTERLALGELVYTGAVRTPVCAIARTVPFRRRRVRVAAELFAQSGDVHRWLGSLSEEGYTGETPDGRGKSREEAGARLARMICADASTLREEELTGIAAYLAERQVRTIASAIRQVRGRLGRRAPGRAVIVGAGSFLARAAAERVGCSVRDWADSVGVEASRAAPAVAVARLLRREAAR